MNDSGYPFELVGTIPGKAGDNQVETLVYRFVSAKSGHRYVVHIERYVKDLYCIKFFDDTTDDSAHNFSHLVSTYEPRTIFRTLVNISFDVLRHNNEASFMYIGAADDKDTPQRPTRRYRVYKLYMDYYSLDEWFNTRDFDEQSMCVLVNRKAMPTVELQTEFINQVCGFIGII